MAENEDYRRCIGRMSKACGGLSCSVTFGGQGLGHAQGISTVGRVRGLALLRTRLSFCPSPSLLHAGAVSPGPPGPLRAPSSERSAAHLRGLDLANALNFASSIPSFGGVSFLSLLVLGTSPRFFDLPNLAKTLECGATPA